jgi:hypothetical protein
VCRPRDGQADGQTGGRFQLTSTVTEAYCCHTPQRNITRGLKKQTGLDFFHAYDFCRRI